MKIRERHKKEKIYHRAAENTGEPAELRRALSDVILSADEANARDCTLVCFTRAVNGKTYSAYSAGGIYRCTCPTFSRFCQK